MHANARNSPKASGTQKRMHKVTQTREARGGPIDADTLFQDDDPHHQAAAETLRHAAQAEGTGQENDTSALP
jgi:predicted NBD/HSP70 family sugar kinase